ncbi:MAG: PAS-domain containing protein [Pseudomonadota bacterium]
MSLNRDSITDKASGNSLSGDEKAQIVLEGLANATDLSSVCKRYDISRSTYDTWQRDFIDGGKQKLKERSGKDASSNFLDDELCRKIVYAFPGNMLISRPADGSILFRSETTQATFGKRRRTSEHWAMQDEREEFIKALNKNGRVDDMLFSGRKFDDASFPAILSAQLIEHDGETISISTSKDLTRFYAMRDEIEQANARFHEALEAFDIGFVMWDSDFRLVLENQKMATILYPNGGRTRTPKAGDPFEQVVSDQIEDGIYLLPEDATLDQILPMWKQLLESHSKDEDIQLADGRILSGSSHDTQHGGYLLTFKDVTEQRRVEQEKEQLNRRMTAVLDSLDVGVVFRDADMRFVMANKAMHEIAYSKIDPPQPGERIAEIGKRQIEAGTFKIHEESSIMTEDMVKDYMKGFRVELSDGRILRGSSHEIGIDGYLQTFTDITNEVRSEERKLAAVNDAIQALDEGFVLWDADLRFILANQRMYDLVYSKVEDPKPGDSWKEITQKQIDAGLFSIEEVNSIDDFFAKRFKSITKFEKNVDVRLRDGTILVGSAHKTDLGGYLVTFRDVTAERRVEERMNDIIQSLDEGISLYDSDLKFIMRNERRYDMLSEHDHIIDPGTHLGDVTLELASSGRIKLSDGETPQEWSDRIVELTKEYSKGIEITGTDDRDYELSVHDTQLDGYLLTFKDVTEQRRAEIAEREANSLLKLIIDACPASFLVSRLDDGKIIYFPAESRKRFGEVDSTLQFFVDPKDRQKYVNDLMPAGRLDNYPIRFRRHDGSISDGLVSARVVSYKGDDVIVTSTRDISKQLEMQAQLDRQKEVAHQNEKLSALGELLAGVSHELNNPLSIVVGYSLMLQGKVDDPVIDKRISRIGQAAERCAKIVKMFLAMARQKPLELVQCSINELIDATLDVAGYSFKSSGGRIKLELEDNIPPVSADPDQLAQVITNLVINAEQALKEIDNDPRIKVKTRYDDKSRKVIIKVRDNGNGIPKKIQSRVFEPFFTTKEVGTGTGVGLAFCHRTITAHNGTLVLDSSRSEGTTFTIRLPAMVSPIRSASTDEVRAVKHGKNSILIVDDEEIVTELIQDILVDNGYYVTVEHSAVNAVKRLDETRFCAVLSDIKMPNMNGEEFYSWIAENQPKMTGRFAFITGDVMRGEVSQFLESSNIPYLEKPITPNELLTLVCRLCENISEQQQ